MASSQSNPRNLKEMENRFNRLRFHERTTEFFRVIGEEFANSRSLYQRVAISPAGGKVTFADPLNSTPREMLMFGSNNYLGLANHPYVLEQVHKSMEHYGVGIGGPPLLSGYSCLHQELEERLAKLKTKESAMIFSSGYGANVGLVTGLCTSNDFILFDEYMHASFCDGMRMSRTKSCNFRHNDIHDLEALLEKFSGGGIKDIFVAVEGVYSMTGELAPLDRIVKICKRYDAHLIVDDAHGTGVMGEKGKGSADLFGVQEDVTVIMGTFSKSFGVTGGFICASKQIINYLRCFARSYVFSASLPPVVVAAVLAGLDVIERDPGIIERLRSNVAYAVSSLNKLGFEINTQSAIVALPVPSTMNITDAALEFHNRGVFINSIEYPAVPLNQQRFRVSIMATHEKDDIDRLVEAVRYVYEHYR
jgi:glycine C-acetyltransferase